MTPSAGVEYLSDAFVDTVRGHVRPGDPIALVNFPNHKNVGDSAIWLGETAALRELGADIAYVCERRGFSEAALRRALPGGGTILLHGGGNFGDLWPPAQLLREHVVSRFREHKIVQLPQSIHFDDPDNLARARSALDAHPDLTLLWRDRHSYELGREAFDARSELCPDAAFALGGQRPAASATTPMLWLARTDTERKGGRLEVSGEPDVKVVDWLSENRSDAGFTYSNHLLSRFSWDLAPHLRRPGLARASSPVTRAVYDLMARQRLRFGLRLLSSARVVVTDRLHGHVLCMLLGKPNVVVDTGRPGKIKDFLSTWTGEDPLVRVARTPEEALEAGRGLVNSGA